MTIEIPTIELNLILQGFAKLLKEPSERSAIIVLSARLESLTEKACLNFLPGVPLRSQRQRLEALESFGVLDNCVYQILNELAIIRNHFAHSYDDCSLRDEKIKIRVKNILDISDSTFGSKASLEAIQRRFSAQLPAVARIAPPEWFTTDLNHMFVIFVRLATHLLALASIKITRQPKLGINDFIIKGV